MNIRNIALIDTESISIYSGNFSNNFRCIIQHMFYQAIDRHAVVQNAACYSSEHAIGAQNESDASSDFASESIKV